MKRLMLGAACGTTLLTALPAKEGQSLVVTATLPIPRSN
jgi:hypothetical protein